MTEHPITPPPELVQAFLRRNPFTPAEMTYEQFIATRFARWGADMELEACCEWIQTYHNSLLAVDLRGIRRPKPPSLKEQALTALSEADQGLNESEWQQRSDTIRRALEALPE